MRAAVVALIAGALAACNPSASTVAERDAVSAAAPTPAPAITLEDAWTPPTPPGSRVAAGYVRIVAGPAGDRLIAASTSNAVSVEIHEMAMDGPVMRMRPLPDGIVIEPGATVELKPGGLHLMFLDIPTAFVLGEKVPVTLTFEKAGRIEHDFLVRERPSAHTGHGGG